MAIKEIRKVAPLLEYFTKNGGINTVTSAASTGFLPAVVEVLNNPAVGMGLDQLSNGSKTGAIIAAVVIGLRASLAAWRSVRG